jgi:N-acetylneuraminic acid mutarotase
MFGGLHDFTVLQTIEKYDTIADSWVSVYFKLPVPLAKHGATMIDNRSVLICGGMSSDFEATKDCHLLDMQTIKWSKKSSMIQPKLVFSGLFYSNGFTFAIGGNNDGYCESLDID